MANPTAKTNAEQNNDSLQKKWIAEELGALKDLVEWTKKIEERVNNQKKNTETVEEKEKREADEMIKKLENAERKDTLEKKKNFPEKQQEKSQPRKTIKNRIANRSPQAQKWIKKSNERVISDIKEGQDPEKNKNRLSRKLYEITDKIK